MESFNRWLEIFGWIFLAVAVLIVTCFAAIAAVYFFRNWHDRRVHFREFYKIKKRIEALSFVHSFFVGEGKVYVSDLDRWFWADTQYTVVIQNDRQEVIALIGFRLTDSYLNVYQLQGIKGVNLRGLNLSDHLVKCAEDIAHALHLTQVAIQPAHLHTYFDLDETHSLYPQLYEHQARMRRMYDEAPQRHGYKKVGDWYRKELVGTLLDVSV